MLANHLSHDLRRHLRFVRFSSEHARFECLQMVCASICARRYDRLTDVELIRWNVGARPNCSRICFVIRRDANSVFLPFLSSSTPDRDGSRKPSRCHAFFGTQQQNGSEKPCCTRNLVDCWHSSLTGCGKRDAD